MSYQSLQPKIEITDVACSVPPRLSFVSRPTRIFPIDREDPPLPVELLVKSDDETGFLLSGNKVRKLEYVFASILQRARLDSGPFVVHVFTCGGIQSNHARATAILARQCGFVPHLVLRRGTSGDVEDEDFIPEGNLFLNLFVGAEITWITAEEYSSSRNEIMERLAAEVTKQHEGSETRVVVEVIPEGASTALGCWGYVDCVQEILGQVGKPKFPEHIFVATGSAGTVAGLVAGVRLLGIPNCKVWGVAACDSSEEFHRRTKELLEEFGAAYECFDAVEGLAEDRTKFEILDAYKGEAYSVPFDEQMAMMKKIAKTYGMLLDPVYTGKAFFGTMSMIQQGSFAEGSRILFIHTGGVFGLLCSEQLKRFAALMRS